MTYLGREASQHAGEPRELYRFALGARRWLYTSAQEVVVHQGESYQPLALSRGSIEQANELARTGLELRLPRDAELAAQFVAAPPDGVVSVTIYRLHQGDSEVITWWKGRVLATRLSGVELTLRCEPVATSLKRTGLRARYQLNCRHVLYSVGCGALKEAYRVDGTVAVIQTSGVDLQIAAAASKPDQYFVGGYLQSQVGARLIVGHIGIGVAIMAPLVGLQVGDAVQLYAGCDHGLAMCRDRFWNHANYGGFPYIPQKNPFSGDAII